MLFCKLLEENNDSKNEMTKLCIRQRFCDEKDEYIPYKQKDGCKNYDDWTNSDRKTEYIG